ncbi:MAG TPA: FAD-dependent monooxygenase, partial [Amphiplicatus sp.]|nr:FAD-dependent monooxygenase [Amphiplicatus sp.]
LIGDVAHAVHPIAGQGFNLGVKDVAALADVLEEAAGVGLDLGSMSVLENYERWRRFESISLSLGMDAINRLFSNDFAPLRLARDIGMSAVGKAAPLRRFFMRQAGADVGRLPPLMQAER